MELTEYGMDALKTAVLSTMLAAILSSIPVYGTTIVAIFGLLLIAAGVIHLINIFRNETQPRLLWILFLIFGVAFEFGSINNIATVLPYAVYVDIALLVGSAIVGAFMLFISAISSVFN